MSHVNPHFNLVSMVGACTSELAEHGNLWLLLDFCPYGDLKNYLKTNVDRIIDGEDKDPINNRSLINWAYQIANGMQYLSENHIMHGDLAARNILLDEDPFNKGNLIAKISDFGLSKRFYDNITYEKGIRLHVPWKWMAIEYLMKDIFTLNSDVWSFGVLFWEMLSFGGIPYGYQDYDEVLEKLQNGYRLICPEKLREDLSWQPKSLFKDISDACFVSDPLKRASFSKIVEIIKKVLTPGEIRKYGQMKVLYNSTRATRYAPDLVWSQPLGADKLALSKKTPPWNDSWLRSDPEYRIWHER